VRNERARFDAELVRIKTGARVVGEPVGERWRKVAASENATSATVTSIGAREPKRW
jgi:hypothetical protein